jgi:hypothetical protein
MAPNTAFLPRLLAAASLTAALAVLSPIGMIDMADALLVVPPLCPASSASSFMRHHYSRCPVCCSSRRRRVGGSGGDDSNSRGSTSPSLLRALVFGADGRVTKDDGPADHLISRRGGGTEVCFTGGDEDGDTSLLKDALTSSPDVVALLTAVACAAAPPPHLHLHPRLVVRTDVVRVGADEGVVEVALAVPASRDSSSQRQLARVLVAVRLPRPCRPVSETADAAGPDGVAACIVQQLQQLEAQAWAVLSQREDQLVSVLSDSPPPSASRGASPPEEPAAEQRLVLALQEEPSAMDLPAWWTYVGLQASMARECSYLKAMLNEDDFAADLLALCRRGRSDGPGAEPPGVASRFRLARVAAIGPSGVVLKASVDSNGADGGGIVDVAIPFPQGRPANTADDLRERVLTLIESVEQYVPAPVDVVVMETAAATGNVDLSPPGIVLPPPLSPSSPSDGAQVVPDDVKATVADSDRVREEVVALTETYESRLELVRRRMLQDRAAREQRLATIATATGKPDEAPVPESVTLPITLDDLPDRVGVNAAAAAAELRLESLRRTLLHARLQEQGRSARLEGEARAERCRRRMLERRLDTERTTRGGGAPPDVRRTTDPDIEMTGERRDSIRSGGREIQKQPIAPQEEAALAARYAAIADLGERAYAIVKDLAMI